MTTPVHVSDRTPLKCDKDDTHDERICFRLAQCAVQMCPYMLARLHQLYVGGAHYSLGSYPTAVSRYGGV